MREAIGGTWITQLVIVFMFVFVAFLALSINYSKAFRVKNEVLSFIEKNEGITHEQGDTLGSIGYINQYLSNSGYSTLGKCDVGSYGSNNLNNNTSNLIPISDSNKNEKFYYCIKKVKSPTINFPDRAYYEVKLFFKFNLPVMGDITTFKVEGQTKDVVNPADKTQYTAVSAIKK